MKSENPISQNDPSLPVPPDPPFTQQNTLQYLQTVQTWLTNQSSANLLNPEQAYFAHDIFLLRTSSNIASWTDVEQAFLAYDLASLQYLTSATTDTKLLWQYIQHVNSVQVNGKANNFSSTVDAMAKAMSNNSSYLVALETLIDSTSAVLQQIEAENNYLNQLSTKLASLQNPPQDPELKSRLQSQLNQIQIQMSQQIVSFKTTTNFSFTQVIENASQAIDAEVSSMQKLFADFDKLGADPSVTSSIIESEANAIPATLPPSLQLTQQLANFKSNLDSDHSQLESIEGQFPGSSTPQLPTTFTADTCITYINEVQQYLGVEWQTQKVTEGEFNVMWNFLILAMQDWNKGRVPMQPASYWENICEMIDHVIVNPSATMQQAITTLSKFQSQYNAVYSQITGMINMQTASSNRATQDITICNTIISKVPAAQSAVQADMTQIKTVQSTLSALSDSIQTLIKYTTTLSLSNQQIQSLFNDMASDPSKEAGDLNQMQNILLNTPETISNTPAAVQAAFSTVKNGVTSAQNSLTTIENDLITIKTNNHLLPNNLPSGQMYLDTNYLDRLFNMSDPTTAINNYLASLKSANIAMIDIPFAQLCDVNILATGSGTLNPQDTAGLWIQKNASKFATFKQLANAQGFTLDLSFGGEDGTATSWKLPDGDPATIGTNLATWMKTMGFSSADFDVELGGFGTVNDPVALQTFFQSLHDNLSKWSTPGSVILTCLGSVSDGPDPGDTEKGKSLLHRLFYDANGAPIFNNLFDGLNIMSYSMTDYYLDAVSGEYGGAEGWLDVVCEKESKTGKLLYPQYAAKIHYGFEDAVPYTAGHNPIYAPSNGIAAAYQYEKLLTDLGQDGYPNNLGGIFFWPDYIQSGMPDTTFENDLYKELNRWNQLNNWPSS